jgi:N-methylhydantoinase A
MMASYLVAMDIGGTFLDTVVVDESGHITTTKVLSSHEDYTVCIRQAVETVSAELGLEPGEFLSQAQLAINGTTVATNILAEFKSSRVGLITTMGIGDTLYIARMSRGMTFDVHNLRPLPQLVEKRRIREVTERVDKDGSIVVPLNRDEVAAALRSLVEDEQIEALAVSFLWCFINPDHEHAVREIAAQLYPDLPVSLSCEVYPAMREYERTTTTVIDALIAPGVQRYVDDVARYFGASGFTGALRMVHSMGGVATPVEVKSSPVSLINSGPVAGYVGALKFGAAAGRTNIITADVGGTSFDAGIIDDGRLGLRHRTYIKAKDHPGEGYLTGLSMLDVSAIGAGGGSIGWLDARGIIQVGPQSAGSRPGPACFGLGGTEPTLTDACVVLGLLDPANFLGGRQHLDAGLATEAIRSRLAVPGGFESEQHAAAAMFRLAVVGMANNVRSVSIDRGHDPRDFSLFSYGGAGGLFLAAVCDEAFVAEMVVPKNCAVFSAFGALMSDYRQTALRGCPWRVGQDVTPLAKLMDELEQDAARLAAQAGFDKDEVELERACDARFAGQTTELPVPLPAGTVDENYASVVEDAFRAEYARSFGANSVWMGSPVELTGLRVTAVVRSKAYNPAANRVEGHTQTGSAEHRTRQVFSPTRHEWAGWTVLRRAELVPGATVPGPAIIESDDTTIVLHENHHATVDALENVVIATDVAPREGRRS